MWISKVHSSVGATRRGRSLEKATGASVAFASKATRSPAQGAGAPRQSASGATTIFSVVLATKR